MDKKYDHLQAEAKAQELWQKNNTYAHENNPGPVYSIDTPPPTVSGYLHIGHIFSYTQTDIIARYKRMSGWSVFYPFGFDDNGLPTERFVEKRNNIRAHDISRSAFIELCLKETTEVEKQFQTLWQRIGLSVDWSLCYSTIDNNTRKISQLSFIELYKKGYVYRKNEPALYCTTCRTTVAQAELEDATKTSLFNNITFTSGQEKLTIGTTRPELLPACVALFFNPEDKRYQHLANKTAIVPIFGQEVPILADPDVDPEKGTGLVMCCTFGDKTDIVWYKRHNLPYRQVIDLDGKWTEQAGPLAGMRVATARETILKLLQEKGLLTEQKQITHVVNVHERCKKEIEYLIISQWFLKILPFKEKFVELADLIQWYPSFMKSRYINWVENLSWDWCLSRQRFYGIPFPVWHCTSCKEIILAKPEELPIDPQETPYKGQCPCGSDFIQPDTDVMDTWNTSSLTPYICASLTKQVDNLNNLFDQTYSSGFMPMSMRPQAHDIIRTWAFYTIAKSWMHNNNVPWTNIVISGHVLSTEKEKISKSQGNSPRDPENLLNLYPADAIRYWTASGSLGHDMAFSDTQLLIGQKLLVKLWNAFRFAQPYFESFEIKEPETNNLGDINKWLLNNISKCYKNYINYFELNEFNLALDTIEKFFWHDFCDNYIELIKDQLMNSDKYRPEQVEATRWTLYNVGLKILQLYSPFVPHITETIYSDIYKPYTKTPSIHQTRFNEYQTIYTFDDSTYLMNNVLDLVTQVRKLKSEHKLSLKTEIDTLTIACTNHNLIALLKAQEELIKGVTKAHKINYITNNMPTETSLNQENNLENNLWNATVLLTS